MPIYSGVRRGLSDSILNLASRDPYGDGYKQGSDIALNEAKIRKEAAEAGGLEYALEQKKSLPGNLAGVPLAKGITPEHIGAMVGASDSVNPAQLGQLFRDLQNQGIQRRALASIGKPDLVNTLNAIASGNVYTPYKQSGAGPIVNTATGAVDTSSPWTEGALNIQETIEAYNRAHTGQANAAAGASSAAADLSRARAQDVRSGGEDAKGELSDTMIKELGKRALVDEEGEPLLDSNYAPVMDLDRAAMLTALKNRKAGVTEEQAIKDAIVNMVETPPPLPEKGILESVGDYVGDLLTQEPGSPIEKIGETPVGQIAPSPEDLGLSPKPEQLGTGVIGGQTPLKLPIDGIPHDVIGVEPDGRLRIRAPDGREGLFSNGPKIRKTRIKDPETGKWWDVESE